MLQLLQIPPHSQGLSWSRTTKDDWWERDEVRNEGSPSPPGARVYLVCAVLGKESLEVTQGGPLKAKEDSSRTGRGWRTSE